MRILIIGDGGREHVLTHLASQSEAVDEIYCPGKNAGILSEPKCERLDLPEPGHAGIIAAAKQKKIDLIIVGPEKYLAEGIIDNCRTAGLSIFGPTKKAAHIESSKNFAKQLMRAAEVPTAHAANFRRNQIEEAKLYLEMWNKYPVVIKADGLAAGKGVKICQTEEGAMAAINSCFIDDEFGAAGEQILIEEFLVGHPLLKRAELSVMALVDIHGDFAMMLPAQDYKPVYNDDQGPNTGGMGSYAPIPWVTQAMMDEIDKKIFKPIIDRMKALGMPFSGALYAGLIWTAQGPKVIEFNCRFGDPEIQPLSMLLETDLIKVMKHIADGGSIASPFMLQWRRGATVCVVMANHGYPNTYKKDAEIFGLQDFGQDVCVFHAGTKFNGENHIFTNGGRVLGVTAYSPAAATPNDSLRIAAHKAYQAMREITWTDADDHGPYYRTDIAEDVPYKI
ncbi:phosphoribosylamine--glycine ligase [Candidatus Falkowbacteria bacterium]|nr:phosphoribosylamine--glycine ligase [Candidatus Falkowbacteria bacterium]